MNSDADTSSSTTSSARQLEKSLFDEAIRLVDPAEREAFLDRSCRDKLPLRRRLARLLAAQEPAEVFLTLDPGSRPRSTGTPARPDIAPAKDAPVADPLAAGQDPLIGSRVMIGRYRLLQRLGEGGCGVVYLAEQQEPVRRQVALKIIRLGMDTESIISRFEKERQALALMDHPNIARVLDAGATETGRPYFVMELVQGIKITDYCDRNRLKTEERLRLFIRVCHAIQHAHQKGIIHRDIKPSNILVARHDGAPVPKVIDFGIAKAIEGRLDDDSVVTANLQLIGTPAYMSPEQANMVRDDLDTRSDIYSLGVLLHELLTGRTPFDSKQLMSSGVEAMRRTILEREPARLSALFESLPPAERQAVAALRQTDPQRLASALRGDLDWIVLTTLEKDRSRRYETANGLAMDIRRHLDNELVGARPRSRLYRLQKLVRRNQAVFVAGLLVLLALLAGLGASTWLFLRERDARREQARLHEEAERARANESVLRQQAEDREKIAQAAVHLSHGDTAAADALVATIPVDRVQPSLECANVFRALGLWHALAGRWGAAADRHASLAAAITQADASDTDDVSRNLLPAAAAIREHGVAEYYERFRRTAIARFADTLNPISAEQVIKASLLAPTEPAQIRALAPLAAIVAQMVEGKDPLASHDPYMDAWRCFALSLFEHRRGNPEAALLWADRCLAHQNESAPRHISVSLLRAMACRQLQRESEARFDLARSRERLVERFRTPLESGDEQQGFWFDWIIARILLREATALIEQ